MCNLSQGIKEDGIAIGETRFIMKMYKICTYINLCKKKRAFEFRQLGGFCYMKMGKIIE